MVEALRLPQTDTPRGVSGTSTLRHSGVPCEFPAFCRCTVEDSEILSEGVYDAERMKRLSEQELR